MMNTGVTNKRYGILAWFIGLFMLFCIGVTVLITDDSVLVDFQGKQWIWLSSILIIVLPIWLLGYILCPCLTVRILSDGTEFVLMLLGAVQVLYGLAQIAGIYPSRHSLFVLTGTFYNPGPYSGYLAAVLPIALHRMLSVSGRTDRSISQLQYYFSLCVLMLVCCVLPAGMSRAAWIASVISCGYVIFRVHSAGVKSFVSRHRYVVFGVLLFGVICSTGAYFMKRNSADGRLLIWKITSHAIADSPGGEESGRTFSALYGDTQERYFTNGKYSASEAWVAGTPNFAFNEYLQIAAEHGVVVVMVFVVVLLVLLFVVRSRKHLIGIGGCMISLMVFACFSYPLHIPAIVSVWILVVMVLCGESLIRLKREAISKLIFLSAVLTVCIVSINVYKLYSERIQAVREWMPIRVMYHSGVFQTVVAEYGKLYSRMDWHKDFCFEYGRALYNVKCYKEAEEVLQRALRVSGDSMILNLLGRNALDNGEFEKAEHYLMRSVNRLPERIYPYYLLVKLYATTCSNRNKLIKAAERVLYGKPKVNSTAIWEMRQEVRKILKDNGLLDNETRSIEK